MPHTNIHVHGPRARREQIDSWDGPTAKTRIIEHVYAYIMGDTNQYSYKWPVNATHIGGPRTTSFNLVVHPERVAVSHVG